MRPLLPAILLTLPLVACAKPPVAIGPSTNPEVDVETLFTYDGCTIYRFRDGPYHYYARCYDLQPGVATFGASGGKSKYADAIPTFAVAPDR